MWLDRIIFRKFVRNMGIFVYIRGNKLSKDFWSLCQVRFITLSKRKYPKDKSNNGNSLSVWRNENSPIYVCVSVYTWKELYNL